MRVFPHYLATHDEPFWVPKAVFLDCFDQDDFACRKAKHIEPYFLDSWMTCDGSNRFFILPVVQFVHDRTQFINGRHRTAVLLPHLDRLPIAFATRCSGETESRLRMMIDAWGLVPIFPGESFVLPNLPVVTGRED